MNESRSTEIKKLQSGAPRILREFWANPDSFASALLMMFIDRYGTEALTWHPRTIQMQVSEDFNVSIPKENFDKLMTAIMILTTDYFYTKVDRFIKFCNILAGDDFDPRVFDPADSSEMAWAITEVLMLDPPETKNPFSEEICAYIGEVLKEEGFITPPDVLRIGLKADLSAQVANDYADDPEMFQGIYEAQEAKTEEVNQMVQQNMQVMWMQLTAIPLQHGSTEGLLKRLQKTSK